LKNAVKILTRDPEITNTAVGEDELSEELRIDANERNRQSKQIEGGAPPQNMPPGGPRPMMRGPPPGMNPNMRGPPPGGPGPMGPGPGGPGGPPPGSMPPRNPNPNTGNLFGDPLKNPQQRPPPQQ